jgi:hypothetical protein
MINSICTNKSIIPDRNEKALSLQEEFMNTAKAIIKVSKNFK